MDNKGENRRLGWIIKERREGYRMDNKGKKRRFRWIIKE